MYISSLFLFYCLVFIILLNHSLSILDFRGYLERFLFLSHPPFQLLLILWRMAQLFPPTSFFQCLPQCPYHIALQCIADGVHEGQECKFVSSLRVSLIPSICCRTLHMGAQAVIVELNMPGPLSSRGHHLLKFSSVDSERVASKRILRSNKFGKYYIHHLPLKDYTLLNKGSEKSYSRKSF